MKARKTSVTKSVTEHLITIEMTVEDAEKLRSEITSLLHKRAVSSLDAALREIGIGNH